VAGSPVLFLGRAIGQQIVPNDRGGQETETALEVEKIWKGDTGAATIYVRTCGWDDGSGNESVTCGGFSFRVGSRYVVFASGNPLSTSECVPTTSVERAAEVLQWLSTHNLK